jgi:protein O-mannosyl-transferase
MNVLRRPGAISLPTATLAVGLFAVLLYLTSAWNGFAYDDNLVIRLDTRIHDLALWHRILLQPYWIIENLGLYRPLVSLGFAVDWAISGGSPAWFHLVNVAWNAAACMLLFLLLARFAAVPFALAGALVFAAHPVHTEAVANVVGRAELMAAVFSLAAMLLWLRPRTGPDEAAAPLLPATDEPLPARRLAAVLLLFALALLSKESAVMLPALLALCDIASGRLQPERMTGWLRIHAVPIAAMAAVTAAWLSLRAAVLGTVGPGLLDPVFDVARSRPERLLTALQAWPEFARLFFYPRVLLAEYGPPYLEPAMHVTPQAFMGGAILLALLGGGLIAFLHGRGRLAFTLLFVPVALLPTSNLLIPIGVVVAERTLYLPSVALAAAVAFALPALLAAGSRRAVAVALVASVTLFSARTLQRIPEWDSTDRVLGALLRDQPDSFRGNWHFAAVAREAGDPPVALQRYASALSVWPFRKSLTLEAATYAAEQRNLEMARQVTAFGVERWPDDVRFLRLQAAIFLDGGAPAEALRFIERGLALAPEDSTLRAMHMAVQAPPP